MASSREGVNPLRPYYTPPSAESLGSSAQNVSTSDARRAITPKASLGSSARDMLSDLDYSDYLNDASPSIADLLRSFVDQGLWKYTSILMAQPFDVAKTVLQVQLASAVEERSASKKQPDKPVRRSSRQQPYDLQSDDSGDDSASYFTSTAPLSPRTPRSSRFNRRHFTSRSPSPEEQGAAFQPIKQGPSQNSRHTLALTSTSSLTAVLSHLWQAEGAWGVWKGTNSTFIHNILLSSLTTFMRSLLCAVFALPDPSSPSTSSNVPGGLDILSSPSPLLSLFTTTLASALAAMVLAPVDIARTKLILTPSSHLPRTLPATIRGLSSWTLPPELATATVLHSALPTLVSASTPLFCRARLGIDPVVTPTAYALATFTSQALELALKLPVETVLRRGQIAFASRGDDSVIRSGTKAQAGQQARSGEHMLETVVPLGPFRGLFGTMYHITFEEGQRISKTDRAKQGIAKATGKAEMVRLQQKEKKGQGIEGLYRGWRVGAWGLLGVWSAAMLGGPSKGGEF